MKIHLHQNDKHPAGLAAAFPYSALAVENIKQCIGFQWDPKARLWRSEGPEVLLDMQRFGVGIDWFSSVARDIAEDFRANLWDLTAIRGQPFGTALYGYQKQGTDFLAAQRAAILGDDMGTGKTKQALDALRAVGTKRCLVVCPKTVVYNWQAEALKWQPAFDVAVVPEKNDGNQKNLRESFWKQKPAPQVTIANYEKLLLKDWPTDVEWDVVIFDEASRLKNSTTATYKAARRQIRFANHIWALTGTPLEIRLDELYSIFSLLRPAVLGNWGRFRHHHMELDWGGELKNVRNLGLLRERIGPWMLRRTKAEVLPHLPPKAYQNNWIKMSIAEQHSYQHIMMDFDKWFAEHGYSGMVDGPGDLRARQFCCTPAIFSDKACGKGSKYEALLDMLREWPGRVVVFCFFEEVLKLLRDWLAQDLPASDYKPEAWISGDTSARERHRRKDVFNAGQLGRVFLSTDAGGIGIDLVGADMIVHYDQLWNPQKMHQREDRLHRIGQQRHVQVVNMLMLDSVDVGMYTTAQEYQKLFQEVVEGAEEVMIRKLSASRLRRLMRGQVEAA